MKILFICIGFTILAEFYLFIIKLIHGLRDYDKEWKQEHPSGLP